MSIIKKIGKLQVGTARCKKMQGHSPLLKHLLAHTIVNLLVKLFQSHFQADSRPVRVRQGSLLCYTNEQSVCLSIGQVPLRGLPTRPRL